MTRITRSHRNPRQPGFLALGRRRPYGDDLRKGHEALRDCLTRLCPGRLRVLNNRIADKQQRQYGTYEVSIVAQQLGESLMIRDFLL